MDKVTIPMISMRGVGKSYGSHQVLHDFSLDLSLIHISEPRD